MQEHREKQTSEDKNRGKKENKERMQEHREKQTLEDKNRKNKENKERMLHNREKETHFERKIKNKVDMERKQAKHKTDLERLLSFQKATRYGPIFVCSSCDQMMYHNGVCKLDENLTDKLKSKNIDSYNKVLADNIQEISLETSEQKAPDISAYICFTCKKHLKDGKLPPMSRANSLQLVDLLDNPDLKLSELENNLISKRLLFQKIYQLPRSRMAGCKDRLINIPINDEDVLNSVNRLPRTPSEAGLVEIKLKRKLEYNNYHKKEYVDPRKIFTALDFLKKE